MLGILSPFPLLADIIPVLLMCTPGNFDMCAVKTSLDGGKFFGILEGCVQVGVVGSLFTYLVTHAPVVTAGQCLQIALDGLMVQVVFLGIVNSQLILSACNTAGQKYSFLLL